MIKERIVENVGIIYLNRPKQINALNTDMIKEIKNILIKWESDDRIKLVLFDSLSNKGFCAGGDLKEIYNDFINNDNIDNKDGFFKLEFDLDKYINSYSKPIISHWFGVTMGGGIGLSINSDLIICDQTVNWAMPETSLGFTPDVGVCHYISKLPRPVGQYVGLLGVSLNARDLINYNLADISIKSIDYEKLLEEIFALSKDYEGNDLIEEIKKEGEKFESVKQSSRLEKYIDKVNQYFSKDTIKDIYESLESNKEDDFANECITSLEARDPYMLTIQFEKYFLCKELDYEQTIDLDLRILQYAIRHKSIDEGIRAKIIDKDNKANWEYKSLEEISFKDIKKLLDIERTHIESLEKDIL